MNIQVTSDMQCRYSGGGGRPYRKRQSDVVNLKAAERTGQFPGGIYAAVRLRGVALALPESENPRKEAREESTRENTERTAANGERLPSTVPTKLERRSRSRTPRKRLHIFTEFEQPSFSRLPVPLDVPFRSGEKNNSQANYVDSHPCSRLGYRRRGRDRTAGHPLEENANYVISFAVLHESIGQT